LFGVKGKRYVATEKKMLVWGVLSAPRNGESYLCCREGDGNNEMKIGCMFLALGSGKCKMIKLNMDDGKKGLLII